MGGTHHRSTRALAVVFLLSIAAACQSNETASPTSSSTSTVPAETSTVPSTLPAETTTVAPPTTPAETTTVPAATTTLPPVTTIATTTSAPTPTLPPPPPPAPCGVFAAIPAGALEVNTVTVDGTGDGTADDTLTSYFDPAASQWLMRLDLPVGSTSELQVTGVGAGFVEVLGAVQVDGGGADEFLAVAGSGPATLNLGVFGADSDGCLFRFTDGGSAFVAPVGATVTRQSGLSCSATTLSRASAEDTGGGVWNVISQTIGRPSFTELTPTASSIVGGVATADLGDIATLNCPGISL